MADINDEKAKAAEQASLLDALNTSDVKVAEDKAEKMKENILNDRGSANYLGIGIYDVTVTSVELTQAKTGTLGIRFNVENEEGRSDVTKWLSEGALPYTIESVSRLMVHNADKDKKDAARTFMSNITSAKELYKTLLDTLKVRGEKKPFVGVLTIREARNGSTYTDKNGVEQPSLERDLLSYRPKETPTQSVAKDMGGGTIIDEATKLEIPFD